MQQEERLKNEISRLIAMRIVNDREMVVDFLRSRTKYEIPVNCSNGYLASVLSDMVFDEDSHVKLTKILSAKTEFCNVVEPISWIIIGLTLIGTGATVTASVRKSQEERESAISGLTRQQVEYDKQILEDREKRQGDFLAQVIAHEREIQEEQRQAITNERRQLLIYLSIFIAVLTISFGLILNKK
jgi:Fe2+ transport system protein B